MESNFKLEFELIQHTPLIHFQYEHSGATLRASEVKPKLDKFLIEKLRGFDSIWEENKNFFVGVGENTNKKEVKPALNYKLRFLCDNLKVYDIPQNSIYYGNMGQGTNKAMFVTGNTKAVFLCFIPELTEQIKKYVNEFFICNNFGRMQNKGFGSFTVKGMNTGNIPKILAEHCHAEACYSFLANDTKDPIRKDTFSAVKDLYSVTKSGKNFGGYTRSLLFRYFYDKNTGDKSAIGNEKRYMKDNGISPNIKKSTTVISASPVANKYKFTRSLLGVGDKIEYIKDLDINNKPKRDERGKVIKEMVSISSDKIKRFSSPIFFKVIDNKVYVVAKRINDVIYDKPFVFKNKATGASETLYTPSKSEFDIDEFMEYVSDKYSGTIKLRREV